MRCDAAREFLFLETTGVSGWIVIWGIVSFYIFFTGARLNKLIPANVMGLKILKWKCACGSKFYDYMEVTFLENEYHIKSSVCRNHQRTNGYRS